MAPSSASAAARWSRPCRWMARARWSLAAGQLRALASGDLGSPAWGERRAVPVAVRGGEAFRDQLFGDAIEVGEGGGLCADVWVGDHLREPRRDAVRFEALEESVRRLVPAPCVAAVPDCRAAAQRRLPGVDERLDHPVARPVCHGAPAVDRFRLTALEVFSLFFWIAVTCARARGRRISDAGGGVSALPVLSRRPASSVLAPRQFGFTALAVSARRPASSVSRRSPVPFHRPG